VGCVCAGKDVDKEGAASREAGADDSDLAFDYGPVVQGFHFDWFFINSGLYKSCWE